MSLNYSPAQYAATAGTAPQGVMEPVGLDPDLADEFIAAVAAFDAVYHEALTEARRFMPTFHDEEEGATE